MARQLLCVAFLLTCFGTFSLAERILFPSGESFNSIQPDAISDQDEYVDPENTGSLLYSADGVDSRRLGKNILVSQYRSTDSAYFRAHPVFFECAQGVMLNLLRHGIRVNITSGYKTKSEATTDGVTDRFLRTGCALQLKPRDGDGAKLESIAAAVLQVCPTILERSQRDLGLILMSDRIHFHMSGPVSSGPLIQLDGFTGSSVNQANIMDWVLSNINIGLDPASVPATCQNFSSLGVGQHFPPNLDLNMAVGSFDESVTRNKTEDFIRLVQYQGSDIDFSDEESTSQWCGNVGTACPSCDAWIQGNTLQNRCADRVMTFRLMNILTKLKKRVKMDGSLPGTLKVLNAWVEPHSEVPSPTVDPLHTEGRAVTVTFSQGATEQTLGTLAKLASCVGADYVEHRTTHLFIAVKKMQGVSSGGNNRRSFPNTELLAVDPPASVYDEYRLPDGFTEDDKNLYPLFHGAGRESLKLAEGVTVGMFMSPGFSYFRLNPRLVSCLSAVVYRENRRKHSSDPKIVIDVISGFMSNSDNRLTYDPISDKRYGTQNLGVGMQLGYRDAPEGYTPRKLMYTIIDRCASIFDQDDQEMGVGLYKNSVFVDMRQHFTFFEKTDGELPENVTHQQYGDDLVERYIAARDHRLVDPDNTTFACLFANPPSLSFCDFQHEHTEHIQRRRRRRETASSPDDCVPNRETTFCQSTVREREKEIDEIMSIFQRKHNHCSNKDVETVLRKCFGDCGTCLEGEIFEEKLEHCNNFLHWVDWGLENEQDNATNIFVRKNELSQRRACDYGEHCVERAPLFSFIAPTLEKKYRPDPKKSVEELLYSPVDNPSPLQRLLEDMYAMQASGLVKFWVHDDKEMTALLRQLEVVMLYNTKTTLIHIYVEKYIMSKEAVSAVIEAAVISMTTKGCPAVSREILTPYEILEVPIDRISKSNIVTGEATRNIRDHYKHSEDKWMEVEMKD